MLTGESQNINTIINEGSTDCLCQKDANNFCTYRVLGRFSLEMLVYSRLQNAGALRSLHCSQVISDATFDLGALLGTSNPIRCILYFHINLHFCFSFFCNKDLI
jgi:hypothetical protein